MDQVKPTSQSNQLCFYMGPQADMERRAQEPHACPPQPEDPRPFEPLIEPRVNEAEDLDDTVYSPMPRLKCPQSTSTLFQNLNPMKCNKSAYFATISEELSRIEDDDDGSPMPRLKCPQSTSTLYRNLNPMQCNKSAYFATISEELSSIEDEDDLDDRPKLKCGTQLCTMTSSKRQRTLNKLRWRRLVLSAKIKNTPLAKLGAKVKACLPARHDGCRKNLPIYDCAKCSKDLRTN